MAVFLCGFHTGHAAARTALRRTKRAGDGGIKKYRTRRYCDNSDSDRDGDGVNNEDDYFPDDPNASSVPTVRITSPATLITVGASPIRVDGTLDDPDAVLTLNGVPISRTKKQSPVLGKVVQFPEVGGLHHHYERLAA